MRFIEVKFPPIQRDKSQGHISDLHGMASQPTAIKLGKTTEDDQAMPSNYTPHVALLPHSWLKEKGAYTISCQSRVASGCFSSPVAPHGGSQLRSFIRLAQCKYITTFTRQWHILYHLHGKCKTLASYSRGEFHNHVSCRKTRRMAELKDVWWTESQYQTVRQTDGRHHSTCYTRESLP